jgi:hypothetical protein
MIGAKRSLLMIAYGSPAWSRLYGWMITRVPASAQPPRFARSTAAGGSAVPPASARPPADQRPVPSKRPRPELAWLTWQTPASLRDDVLDGLRRTLSWQAQYCQPLDAPKTPPGYRRFGLMGEELVPQGTVTVRETLRAELREMVRTVEGRQPI